MKKCDSMVLARKESKIVTEPQGRGAKKLRKWSMFLFSRKSNNKKICKHSKE